MALKPQSIRKHQTILVNQEPIKKDKLIEISEGWTEKQENFFRKMLKQGGKFKINSVPYEIRLEEKILTSTGEKDMGIVQIPGESARI